MLNLVLVEPEIPQNTGNIARTCAVTGCRLHLVEPMGFTVTDAKLKRAGLDYWHLLDITYHDGLDRFFENEPGPFWYATTKARASHSDVQYHDGDYILFGKETAGLPTRILEREPERNIRIPQRDGARSLNLSNAAAVICYEALRQLSYPDMR